MAGYYYEVLECAEGMEAIYEGIMGECTGCKRARKR
jgi:hypothetical protein